VHAVLPAVSQLVNKPPAQASLLIECSPSELVTVNVQHTRQAGLFESEELFSFFRLIKCFVSLNLKNDIDIVATGLIFAETVSVKKNVSANINTFFICLFLK